EQQRVYLRRLMRAQPMTGPPCDCTRRDFVRAGFGSLLFAGILADLAAAEERRPQPADPLAPRPPHFPARAQRVIFLYMTGGVSHVDSFDPKPQLVRDHGKTVAIHEWQGRPGKFTRYLKKPNWAVRPRGRCGTAARDR